MWNFLPLLLLCLCKIDQLTCNSSPATVAQSTSSVSASPSSTESMTLSPSSGNVSSSPSSYRSDSSVTPNVTIHLSASVFNTPRNNITQPTATSDLQTPQTVNGSSVSVTAEPAIGCADINWENPNVTCSDVACVQKQMKILAVMLSCPKPNTGYVSFSRTDIPKKVISLGMDLAKTIKIKLERNDTVNTTAVVMVGNMAMEVGVIDSANEPKTRTFPKYTDATFIGTEWAGMVDIIEMPMEELTLSGLIQYAVAIMPNVFGDKCLNRDEMNWEDNSVAESEMSELYVISDQLLTRKKVPKKRINSNLLSASFRHNGTELKGPFKTPAILTLGHFHSNKEHFETTCAFLDGNLWSKDGCNVKETSGSQTTCTVTINRLSTFALISKVKEKSDDSARKLVVTVATVLGSFSILGLLICVIVAIVINYNQRDHMRIALNIDVSLLLSQLVFFIGLPTEDNLFFSSPKTCEIVSPFLHFFELAALSWLLMEGLHYYSTLKPLFNEKNTVPIVFYFAVGWGLPIAFASACAEFSYPHFGSPERSEFCWMFVRGSVAWFFGAPVLILVLLNLLVRAFILKEAINWEDDPDDIRLERAKNRLVTSIVIMLAIVLTWFFGILAVNNTDHKIYHYFFIMFYTLQGLLVLLFYCVRNHEMWEYRKHKKDEEEKEKKKTYDFVYHP